LPATAACRDTSDTSATGFPSHCWHRSSLCHSPAMHHKLLLRSTIWSALSTQQCHSCRPHYPRKAYYYDVPLRRTTTHLLIFSHSFKASSGQPEALQHSETKPVDLYVITLNTAQPHSPPLALTHFYSTATVQPHMSLFCACSEKIKFCGVFYGHHASVLRLCTFANNILEAALEYGNCSSSIQETARPSVSDTHSACTIQLK
jgi:hypothetical protein